MAPLEAVDEAWEWEEHSGQGESEGEEQEGLRVGKDGWRYEPKGEEHQADG